MQLMESTNNACCSTQAPNIRGVLQYIALAAPNERRTSTQAPNIRGLLQCSTSALTIKDVVQ